MPVNITGGGLEFDATINGSQFQQQIRNIERDLNRLAQTTEQRGAELEGIFKRAASAAAGFFSIQAAQGFISQLVAVRGEFEQLGVAYSTILKSKSKGDALFQETIQLASTTPFNLTEVAQSTKQLLAYGVAAKDVTGTLKMLGDIASGVSAPIGDIAYLYGTLKTQGRAYMMDIRQFTGRGIPIIAELAKQFHVTEGEVNKLVEAGKVGFPEVEKAFKNLTSSGGIFFNLMEEQSKTLTGRLSNLQDAFAQMLNEIGKSNSGLLNDGITGLATLVDHYKEIIDVIELLVIGYGSYKAALIAEVAVSKLVAFTNAAQSASHLLLQGAVELSTAAQVAYNSAAVQSAIVTAAYTAVIAAVVVAVKSWSDATELSEGIQKSFNAITKASNEQVETQKTKISDLTKIVLDHNSSQADRLAAIKKINEISPDYLGNITEESFRTGEAAKSIDKYLDALNRKLIGEAAYSAKLENQKRINELKTKGINAISPFERTGISLQRFYNNTGSLKSKFSGEQESKEIVEGLINQLESANAKMDLEFKQQMKEALLGVTAATSGGDEKAIKNAAYFQQIIDTNTKGLKELDVFAKDFKTKSAAYKRVIAAAQKELSLFDVGGDKRANDQLERELVRRGDLIRKIYDLNQKYNGKLLGEDEQKVQGIRDEYDKLRAEIDKYNANPKNKVKVGKAMLQQNENAAINNQVDLNTNDAIKADIEAKKTLYAEYNIYKEKLGKDAAAVEYKTLLQSGESYSEYLQRQADEVQTGPLSGTLQARKDLIDKAMADEKRVQTMQFTDLLASSLTYTQQRTIIIDKYLKQAADLREKGYKEEAAQAIKNGEDELTNLDEANIKKLDAYKDLFDGIKDLSEKQAKENIASVQKYIDQALKGGTITKGAYSKISKQLKDASKAIESALPAGLRQVSGELTNMSGEVGKFNEELGKSLSIFAGMLNYAADIKENVNSIRSPKTDTFGKITAGLGLIGSAIGIVTTIAGLFSRSKENAEQQAYTNDLQLKATEAVNKALERQLALTKDIYGPERLTAYAKSLGDIKKAQEDAYASLNGRLTLSGDKIIDEKYIAQVNNGQNPKNPLLKPGVEQLKQLGVVVDLTGKQLEELQKLFDSGKLDAGTAAIVQSLADLQDKATDTLNAFHAETTGTQFSEIADSIVALFENGTTAAEDFGKNFEQIMQKSILNSFKRNALQDQLQGFYDQFFEFSKSDGALTDVEIAKLKAQYDGVIAGAQKQFTDLEKATGIKFGGDSTNGSSSSSSLTGAIKGVTEDTASGLLGIARGNQLNTYNTVAELKKQSDFTRQFHQDSLRYAVQNLELLTGIRDNTKRSADTGDAYLPFLKEIAKNTGDSTNALLRGFGI